VIILGFHSFQKFTDQTFGELDDVLWPWESALLSVVDKLFELKYPFHWMSPPLPAPIDEVSNIVRLLIAWSS